MIKNLIISFGVAFILTPLIRKFAIYIKLYDHPDNPRKIHKRPVPLLGSIAVFFGVFAGIFPLFFHNPLNKEIFIVFGCAIMLLIIGLLDDIGKIHSQIKLMVGMPIAGLILIFTGLGLKIFPFAFLNYFFTIFWVVGITAAYNLLDGMDGLSSGICMIASTFYFVFGLKTGDDTIIITLSLALMGTSLGFLIFNFHPAKIFLGDSGAIFLGFLLAALGLRVANSENLPVLTRWMIPILILIVPIFDTSLITISRARRGLIPFLHPGKDHVHHRLYNLSLSQRKTVILMYFLGFLGGMFSTFIYRVELWISYTIFSLIIATGLILIGIFEKFPYEK